LLEPEKKGAKGEGFDVLKSGGEWLSTMNMRSRILNRFDVRCSCGTNRLPFRWKINPALKSHEDREYNRRL
jgi:hypothetical protein